MTKKVARGCTPVAPEPSPPDASGSEPEHADSLAQESCPAERAGHNAGRKRPSAAGVPQHYSLQRLAEHWDVSTRTVRRMIDDGELRATMIRGQLRVPVDEARDYEVRNRR